MFDNAPREPIPGNLPDLVAKYREVIEDAPGSKIIPPNSYLDIPLAPTENMDDTTGFFFSVLRGYLDMPIVTDEFPKHADRREWKKAKLAEAFSQGGTTQRDELNAALSLNKLKANHIGQVGSTADLIAEIDPSFKENPDIKKLGN